MSSLTFHEPPPISLWRAAIKRGRGGEIPRIVATAEHLPTDASAYARICGFPSADPLPLTWPAVATAGLQGAVTTAPEFPLPLLGIVHARQRVVRRRHLTPGEPLAARCTVEGHRVVRSGGEFDLVVEVTDASGAEVWHGVTTVHSRAIRGHGGDRAEPPAGPAWTPTCTSEWQLPADLGRRYAAICGDYNPIHLSPWTSWLFGYKRPIAHGWWALAHAVAEMGDAVPEVCTLDVRFIGPMSLPGTLAFRWGPASDGGTRFELAGEKPCIIGELRAGA
jgi:acyl dehydratase